MSRKTRKKPAPRPALVSVRSIPAELEEATRVYFEAHSLLPERFEAGAPSALVHADLALALINCEAAPLVERLRAIAILGHAPCAEALAALEELADSTRPLAAVAEIAASECADWLTEAELGPLA